MALACAPAAGASGAGPRSLRASIIRGPALPCIDRRRTWRPGVSRRAQAQVEVALPPIEVEHADVVTGPLGDAPEPRRRRGLLAVTCILGGYVVGMLNIMALSSSLPVLRAAGMGSAEVGALVSLTGVANSVGKVMHGALAAQVAPRSALVWVLTAAAALSYTASASGRLDTPLGCGILTASICAQRLATSGLWLSATRMVQQWFAPAAYPRLLGAIAFASRIGSFGASFGFGALLMRGYPWQSVFHIAAGAAVLAAVAIATALPPSPALADRPARARPARNVDPADAGEPAPASSSAIVLACDADGCQPRRYDAAVPLGPCRTEECEIGRVLDGVPTHATQGFDPRGTGGRKSDGDIVVTALPLATHAMVHVPTGPRGAAASGAAGPATSHAPGGGAPMTVWAMAGAGSPAVTGLGDAGTDNVLWVFGPWSWAGQPRPLRAIASAAASTSARVAGLAGAVGVARRGWRVGRDVTRRLPPPPAPSQDPPRRAPRTLPFLKPFADAWTLSRVTPAFGAVVLARCCYAVVFELQTFLPVLLSDSIGLTPGQAASAGGFFSVGAGISVLAFSTAYAHLVADPASRVRVMQTCATGAVLSLGMLAVAVATKCSLPLIIGKSRGLSGVASPTLHDRLRMLWRRCCFACVYGTRCLHEQRPSPQGH